MRRGANYIEVDVDVGSSRSAANVVGLVQGALKTLVIDLAVLLEGHSTVRGLPLLPQRFVHRAPGCITLYLWLECTMSCGDGVGWGWHCLKTLAGRCIMVYSCSCLCMAEGAG